MVDTPPIDSCNFDLDSVAKHFAGKFDMDIWFLKHCIFVIEKGSLKIVYVSVSFFNHQIKEYFAFL